MESSVAGQSSEPTNPTIQKPVRDYASQDHKPSDPNSNETAPFTTEDLRRWEDQRISQLNDNVLATAAALEGTQEELKGVFRNELVLAFACLVAVGFMFGIGREVMKMKEEASGASAE